ncbi:MAG: hypothetical protein ACJA08_003121, partial [Cyclobacteriaceae bacterium]
SFTILSMLIKIFIQLDILHSNNKDSSGCTNQAKKLAKLHFDF